MKTEAEKKAQKKYQNKIRTTTKAQLNCTIDRDVFNAISEYCAAKNMSKAALVTKAIKYCIDNNVDLKQGRALLACFRMPALDIFYQ